MPWGHGNPNHPRLWGGKQFSMQQGRIPHHEPPKKCMDTVRHPHREGETLGAKAFDTFHGWSHQLHTSARDKKTLFHLWSNLEILSMRGEKWEMNRGLDASGNPRYFTRRESSGNPKFSRMPFLSKPWTLLKKIWDLVLLMSIPDVAMNSFRASASRLIEPTSPRPNKRRSSANAKCVISPPSHLEWNLNSPNLVQCFGNLDRYFMQRRTNVGEMRSPCRRPCFPQIKPCEPPLIERENVGRVTHVRIQ